MNNTSSRLAIALASVVLALPIRAQGDECSQATPVAGGANGPFSNVAATDSSEPWPCASSASADVWFSYQATCSGTAQAATCGAGFDTKIEAFAGSCGTLTSLGCNDDSCGLQSTLSWPVVQGASYFIRVGGFNGATGTFPLDITCSSLLSNDDCAAAVTVSEGTQGPFSNAGATAAAPFPCVLGGGGADVWFRYLPSNNGLVTVSTCGAGFDTCIEVCDGNCNALHSLVCNDDACNLQSRVEFLATASVSYYIRVGGYAAATGTFMLELENEYGVDLHGIAETIPGSGSLGAIGGLFTGGDTIRFNYVDAAGNGSGKAAVVVLNFDANGPLPAGMTPAFPGFAQLWAGSAPAGVALLFPVTVLPSPDQSLVIPQGFFLPAGSIRLQGVLLDPTRALGVVPVVATRNTVKFVATAPCQVDESFEGLMTGANYPVGWGDGGGTLPWLVHSGATPTAGTGPTAAFEGGNYVYCEASAPAAGGSTWILDSAVYPTAGLSALAFQLSRVGDAIGTLEVRMGDGTGAFPTLLMNYSGQGATVWTQEILALGSNLPANVQFRFQYGYGGGFGGDIAIDAFCLQ